LADDDSELAQREKRRLLELADLAMNRVKLVADACVGAYFAADVAKAREVERQRRRGVIEKWLAGDEGSQPVIEEWSREIRRLHAPFHWWLELPEVFFHERPDPLEGGRVNRLAFVDAFLGNPPFAGKDALIASNGPSYPDWLRDAFPGDTGVRGNCDVSAYFFRRAFNLIGRNGVIGFLATNTIGQGDTRRIGLKHLVHEGASIFEAVRSMSWPGAAAVNVAIVHLARGSAKSAISSRRLDGAVVTAISSRLRSGAERSDPDRLKMNELMSFQGSVLLGTGFTVTFEDRQQLLLKNQKNSERLFPFLGGEEVNTSPTQAHDRYVISFGQMSLDEASRWPDLLDIILARVKPERDRLSSKNSVTAQRKARWWLFAGASPQLYTAIAKLERCLVTARLTKHLLMSFQPTDRVFSEQLYVFPLASFSSFAILQSRIHEAWVRLLSSSLEDRLRYTAADCFETFPFPRSDPSTVISVLEGIGDRLYNDRARYMIDTNQGLTQTYNRLKDPKCDEGPILQLRELHEEMDRAVLESYGWTDLDVPPFCPLIPAADRALAQFQDAVIDRLFALNAERANEERRLGAVRPSKTKKVRANTASKLRGGSDGAQSQLTLDVPVGEE
jgi:hypothetical protein